MICAADEYKKKPIIISLCNTWYVYNSILKLIRSEVIINFPFTGFGLTSSKEIVITMPAERRVAW